MPRARQIKYSFFENEILGVDGADPLCSLMFIGLWCLADRDGRLVDRPLKIKGKLFPLRNIADPNGLLDWLMENGFIDRYEVDGQRYIQILNFTLHQNPHPNEKVSEIPKKLSKNEKSRTIANNRDKQPCDRALTSFSSFPSLSSFEDGETPVAAVAAAETDIWSPGIKLLSKTMTEAQARPFLGRLAKKYTAAEMHTAIEATAAEKPVDPPAFLIGVLKKRSQDKAKGRVGEYDPNREYVPPPPCRFCGKEICFLLHRDDVDAQAALEAAHSPPPAIGTG